MSGLRTALCFAGAFVAGLLIAAPLQLVIADAPLPGGLSASRVEGSPWRGRLHHVEWQGVALGEVRAALLPLPLLAGHKVLRLETGEATLSLHGGRVRGVSRVDGLVPLPSIQGLSSRVLAQDARLLFDEDGCREAGGRVRVEVALPGNAYAPLLLAGTPACDGRAGRVVLTPEDAAHPLWLEATFSAEADGHHTLSAIARSDDPVLRAALLAQGFQDAPGGLSRVFDVAAMPR